MSTLQITATDVRRPLLDRTLWGVQIALGLFMAIGSAAPKLWGEPSTVQSFHDMGASDGFRIFIGLVELAGGIGLLIPVVSGAAATGLVLLMVGATITNVWVVDKPVYALTPIVLGLVFAVVARRRLPRTVAAVRALRRR